MEHKLELILRWRDLIETSINEILRKAKEEGRISRIPISREKKIDIVRKLFKRDNNFLEVINLYEMFLEIRSHDKEIIEGSENSELLFILYKKKWNKIDIENLKRYIDSLEEFINTTKKFILS